MPFPDEMEPVRVVAYRSSWPGEFTAIAHQVWSLRLADLGAVDHIGSTSVPGLAAKDVIDVQVRVPVIESSMASAFDQIGFRKRSERWNCVEATRGGDIAKLVFAAPVDARPANVHVRRDATAGAADALLFRDFLRENPDVADEWGEFKQALVEEGPATGLVAYGTAKQPAWKELMRAADSWAREADWVQPPLATWAAG